MQYYGRITAMEKHEGTSSRGVVLEEQELGEVAQQSAARGLYNLVMSCSCSSSFTSVVTSTHCRELGWRSRELLML